ncbi:MAG: M15 family metallopeptidase [Candidatus Firestonebacteria bacterium]|nr:M15 family metallopeptidase [Candidatus Firestonebacteria bacterium]
MPIGWLQGRLLRAALLVKLKAPVVWRVFAPACVFSMWAAVLVSAWVFLTRTPPEDLWRAYPAAIEGFQQTPRGWLFLLRNGLEIPYCDGLNLNSDQRLEQSDLETVLSQAYVPGEASLPVGAGKEPGRFRNYDLLKAAYGATPDEVRRNLVTVDFCGLDVAFNVQNGAAAALRDAAAALSADPEAAAYVRLVAGKRLSAKRGGRLKRSPNISSWYWRNIAGTQRLSAHSFGIALDLNKPNPTRPAYWRWVSLGRFPRGFEDVTALEPVSWRVIDIFEKHGFIWGGKWHHFDTMHFEYRPEFFASRRPQQACEGGRQAHKEAWRP